MKAFLIRLAKAILKMAMDETLRRGLPQVYKQLDAEMPQTLAPRAVEQKFAHAIANATGGKVSRETIELVALLYDPIKAALK
jgi:hypothetical protein